MANLKSISSAVKRKIMVSFQIPYKMPQCCSHTVIKMSSIDRSDYKRAKHKVDRSLNLTGRSVFVSIKTIKYQQRIKRNVSAICELISKFI